MSEPIGNLIDALGVEYTPRDDDLVSGAVVLLKVIQSDGSVRLHSCWSDGLSWIERLGMLRAAERDEQS